jgi:hypothetical protein
MPPVVTPTAPSIPTVTPVSTTSIPTAVQAMASVDPCYSGNASMVCAAQSALGLTADGKYGAATAAALRRLIPGAPGPCSPTPPWWGHAGENKCGGGAVPSVPSMPSMPSAPTAPTPVFTPTAPAQATTTPTQAQSPTTSPTASSTTTITTGPDQPIVTAPEKKEGLSTGAMVAGGLGVAALVGIVAVVATSKHGGHGGGGHRPSKHSKPHHTKPHHKSKKRRK